MKKILVTGGAGFVGRHIIYRQLKLGNEVHCVDNLSLFTGAKDPIRDWKVTVFAPKDLNEIIKKVKNLAIIKS
jgi:nucleoside-diphosphate-sugar epimerase